MKFDCWEGVYDHVLQSLHGAPEFVVRPFGRRGEQVFPFSIELRRRRRRANYRRCVTLLTRVMWWWCGRFVGSRSLARLWSMRSTISNVTAASGCWGTTWRLRAARRGRSLSSTRSVHAPAGGRLVLGLDLINVSCFALTSDAARGWHFWRATCVTCDSTAYNRNPNIISNAKLSLTLTLSNLL